MLRNDCLRLCVASLALVILSLPVQAASTESVAGNVELSSVGPIAFAPEGVLLLSDPMAATIYAIQTEDTGGDLAATNYDVKNLNTKVAAVLGTVAEDVRIADLAVNPSSGNVYLSVSRGSGPEAEATVLVLNPSGDISELTLTNANHTKAVLPNSPKSRKARRGDPRMMSVTDIAFLDGRVVIAGLSNEEFASKLHYINYPFTEIGSGTSVEIFHGAHGKVETRSPIMTFCGYSVQEVPHVLAAYTCTPLVAFPVSDLESPAKLRGKTVAELGNRNRPLDMFVYTKDGKDYVLMANNNRGMMKISLEDIATANSIDEPVSRGATSGLPYDSLQQWQGVVQLDRLNGDHAVVLVQGEGEEQNLQTKLLP